MPLSDIGIVVQGGPASASHGLSGNAVPVLLEVRDLLNKLVETGESGAIDLRGMPLNDSDLAWLAERLGEGELRVSLDSHGVSTIVETQAPGVWWVTHRNEKDTVVSEFIEITWVPDLIAAQREDAILGLAYLDSLIFDLPR